MDAEPVTKAATDLAAASATLTLMATSTVTRLSASP